MVFDFCLADEVLSVYYQCTLLVRKSNLAIVYGSSFLFSVMLTNQLLGTEPFLKSQLSLSQEVLHFLCNLKVHYCVYKSPPVVPIMSEMHLVHTLTSHCPKIHYNILSIFA